MTKIKSKKAVKFIKEQAKAVVGTADHINIYDAKEAVIIAETELEEHYIKTVDKVLKDMLDAVMEAYRKRCMHLIENNYCTCSSIQVAKCPKENYICGHMNNFLSEISSVKEK